MGFLDGIGRLLTGKPVFVDVKADKATQSAASRPDESTPPLVKNGRKIIPEVIVTHVKARLIGANLETWATIRNISEQIIYLDKIHFLGQKTELDRELRPQGAHNYLIYRGPALTSKPNADADIEYRLQVNGDYFQAQFFVEFYMEGKNFLPEEFHPEYPIRDI